MAMDTQDGKTLRNVLCATAIAPEIESRVHDRDDSVSTAAPAKNTGAAAGQAV